MSPEQNKYPKASDINPKTGRPYGLGTPSQKLDPVIYPDGHTREQQDSARAARQARALAQASSANRARGVQKKVASGLALAMIGTGSTAIAAKGIVDHLNKKPDPVVLTQSQQTDYGITRDANGHFIYHVKPGDTYNGLSTQLVGEGSKQVELQDDMAENLPPLVADETVDLTGYVADAGPQK